MAINPFDLLKNAQFLKDQMSGLEEDLKNTTVVGKSGAGLVEVTINGKFQVLDMKIDKTIIDPEDPGTLQTLIASAFNDAASTIQNNLQKKSMDLASQFQH